MAVLSVCVIRFQMNLDLELSRLAQFAPLRSSNAQAKESVNYSDVIHFDLHHLMVNNKNWRRQV